MRLSSEHANQQTYSLADFSGGINTSSAPETIADNELADCVNMDVDQNTRLLKTVSGTQTVYMPEYTISYAIYDKINNCFLLVDDQRNVYRSDLKTSSESLGKLEGTIAPKYTEWEDGVLIAAGGKLQYYNGTALVTIEKSESSTYDPPTDAEGVYIRAGRVLVDHKNEIVYSGVGDETQWKQDDNDPSTSKFIETGYKDGGKIIGMTSLSNSIIVIKNNNRVYKVSGEFPNWSVAEISRNVDCRSRQAFCSVVDNTVILGRNRLQIITTTDEYGDMKVINTGQKVAADIADLPDSTKVVFVPPLNQVWLIANDGYVLIYDLMFSSFYKRQFKTPIIDVISVNEAVYIIKPDRVSILSSYHFADDDKILHWNFKTKRLLSINEYLLKRCQVNFTPYYENYALNHIYVGRVLLKLPVPYNAKLIYNNTSPIYDNLFPIHDDGETGVYYQAGDPIYQNSDLIYRNSQRLYPVVNIFKGIRCVYRNKTIDIRGSGAGGAIVINSINFDLAEV